MLAYTAGDSLQAIARTFGVDSVSVLEQKIQPTSGVERRGPLSFRRAFWKKIFDRRPASRA